MILLGHDEMVGAWVAEMFDQSAADFGKFAAMGFMRDGELIAGLVYKNYRDHGDIEMVMAATDPRWCTRKNLRVIFDYPFGQLGCKRVTALVAKGNRRSRKLVEGVGFVLEGIMRKGWDGHQSACIYGMLKAECRWIDSPVFKRAA